MSPETPIHYNTGARNAVVGDWQKLFEDLADVRFPTGRLPYASDSEPEPDVRHRPFAGKSLRLTAIPAREDIVSLVYRICPNPA